MVHKTNGNLCVWRAWNTLSIKPVGGSVRAGVLSDSKDFVFQIAEFAQNPKGAHLCSQASKEWVRAQFYYNKNLQFTI